MREAVAVRKLLLASRRAMAASSVVPAAHSATAAPASTSVVPEATATPPGTCASDAVGVTALSPEGRDPWAPAVQGVPATPLDTAFKGDARRVLEYSAAGGCEPPSPLVRRSPLACAAFGNTSAKFSFPQGGAWTFSTTCLRRLTSPSPVAGCALCTTGGFGPHLF
jgi:hypothetical protein